MSLKNLVRGARSGHNATSFGEAVHLCTRQGIDLLRWLKDFPDFVDCVLLIGVYCDFLDFQEFSALLKKVPLENTPLQVFIDIILPLSF